MLWVLLGCLTIYLLFWITDFERQNRKLPRLLEEARKSGMATTPEEYKALMAAPEAENAAPIYREIAAKLEAMRTQDPETVKYLSDLPWESILPSIPELEKALAATEEIDALYRKAAGYPVCRTYSVDDDNPYDWPELKALRVADRLSLVRAQLSLVENDPQAALDRLEWMQNAIGHAYMEPTKLCLLATAAALSRWLEGLNRIVRHSYAVPGVLDYAEGLLNRLPALPTMREAMRGEVAYVLAYRPQMSGESIDGYFSNRKTPFPLSVGYFRSPRAIDAYVSYGIEKLVEGYRRLPADPDDWVGIGAAIQPDRSIRDWWKRPTYSLGLWYQNQAEVIPMTENRKRLARLGIELFREFNRNGRFPVQLPLGGEAVKDAVSGRLFEYQPGIATFTLKSRNLTYLQ